MHTRLVAAVTALGLCLSGCSMVGARPSPSTPSAAPTGTPATGSASPATTPEPSPTPSASAAATPAPSSSAQAGLDGREFVSRGVIEDGQPKSLVGGTWIRLGFADGRISASAGCNSMGGTYELNGNTLTVGDLAMTEMGCQSSLMAQDEWLANFLGSNPHATLEGDTLVLGSGTISITFLDREQAEPDQPLTGVTWNLTTIVETDMASSIPAGVFASIVFHDHGTFDLNDGCNTGSGKYELNIAAIAFSDIVTTKKACMDEGQTAVSNAVYAVLNADDAYYQVDHSTLHLAAGDHGLFYSAAVDVNQEGPNS